MPQFPEILTERDHTAHAKKPHKVMMVYMHLFLKKIQGNRKDLGKNSNEIINSEMLT